MGMSDKQYDGMLLDFIEDFDDILKVADKMPDCPEKAELLAVINQKKQKTERKLETPVKP